MKYLLFVLAVVACLFAVGEQAKVPKAVKTLKKLCDKATTRGLKTKNENFTYVMDDLTEWCPTFLGNYTSNFEGRMKKYDAVKELGKVCKWFGNKYGDEDPMELEGLGEICEDYEVAVNVTLGLLDPSELNGGEVEEPEKTPKGIRLLIELCKKAEKGKLKWRNETFDDVFEDLIEWCPDFTDALEMEDRMKEGKKFDAIESLGGACIWYYKKFDAPPGEGPLLGLEDICDDFYSAKGMSSY